LEKKLILITGIPGTGKTEIGDYFQSEHGYMHVDYEKLPGGDKGLRDLFTMADGFISPLLKEERDVIVTWGFPPERGETVVMKFKESGFRLFWFDGNRPAALREFLNREKDNPEKMKKELAFYYQMFNILNNNIIKKIDPCIINTFNDRGEFKGKNQIYSEIVNYL
jgi:hypothetical protein